LATEFRPERAETNCLIELADDEFRKINAKGVVAILATLLIFFAVLVASRL
jgi:hypothetical protein